MTLRCPKCGGKRIEFLSMTGGTAVGSTDQRYFCKDCSYRGSFILDTIQPKEKTAVSSGRTNVLAFLIALDIILFLATLLVFFTGQIASVYCMPILFSWIAVFVFTLLYFSAHLSQGSVEWYQQGITILTGFCITIVLGLLLRIDLFGIFLLAPFSVMGAFAVSWLFIDRSEDAVMADLKKLQKEIR